MARTRSAPEARYWCAIWTGNGRYRGIHRYDETTIRMLKVIGTIVYRVSHAPID